MGCVLKIHIKTLSNLFIGGAPKSFEIGGIDQWTAADEDGFPYIPASSLKGALRAIVCKDTSERASEIAEWYREYLRREKESACARAVSLDKQTKMERYSRQIMLPEIGDEGQKKLSDASVLLVGVGGLGSPIALYLVGAGIGRIGLIDADTVSESNLQRQVLYTEKEVGLPKVTCAKLRLQALSGNTQIDTYQTYFSEENAYDLVKKYDLVIGESVPWKM